MAKFEESDMAAWLAGGYRSETEPERANAWEVFESDKSLAREEMDQAIAESAKAKAMFNTFGGAELEAQARAAARRANAKRQVWAACLVEWVNQN